MPDQLHAVERYLRVAFRDRPPLRALDYRLALLGAAPGLPPSTRLQLPGRETTVGELGAELKALMNAPRHTFELGAEGVEVPMKNTPASAAQVAPLLVGALEDRNEHPNRAGASLLHAQLWLESGQGKFMQNNNPGNLTAGARWEGDYWRPPWFEVDEESSARDKRLHERMLEGKAPSKFRSFDTLDQGVDDYVRFIVSSFRPVYEAAQANDPARMARNINLSGYCPASDCPPERVAEDLRSIQRQLLGQGLYRDLPEGPALAVGNASSSSMLLGAAVVGTAGFIFVRTLSKPRRAS